jgi:hypothetical protein
MDSVTCDGHSSQQFNNDTTVDIRINLRSTAKFRRVSQDNFIILKSTPTIAVVLYNVQQDKKNKRRMEVRNINAASVPSTSETVTAKQ